MTLESESALSVQALSVQALSVQALSVQVWRGAAEGRFQTFQVPRRAHQTILDVVTEIQRDQDATLSYRFACRVGMCGSCAMIVNGRPRWTCRTRVDQLEDGTIKLEPLRNLPIVKDLTVDIHAGAHGTAGSGHGGLRRRLALSARGGRTGATERRARGQEIGEPTS